MPLTNLKSSPYSTANLPHHCTPTHQAAHQATHRAAHGRRLAAARRRPFRPSSHEATHNFHAHPPTYPPHNHPAHAPRSRSALCHPRCHPTLSRLAAARRSASLQCPTAAPPDRRRRTSCRYGSRAAAGAPSAVSAFSVGGESAASLAVTTSWLLSASWFCPSAPTRPALPSAPPTLATHKSTLRRLATLGCAQPTRLHAAAALLCAIIVLMSSFVNCQQFNIRLTDYGAEKRRPSLPQSPRTATHVCLPRAPCPRPCPLPCACQRQKGGHTRHPACSTLRTALLTLAGSPTHRPRVCLPPASFVPQS